MKTLLKLIIFSAVLFVSCNDNNVSDMGTQIQPEGDKIRVDTATVSLVTSNVSIDYIYSRPDSFLLGTFVDPVYGTLQSDILTQLQPPIDFKFPENAVADSAKLQLYYVNSWIGSKFDPMQVSVYEMNKNTLKYSQSYKSDIDIADYCDRSIKIGERIISPRDAVSINDSLFFQIPLNDAFKQRFSSVFKTIYALDPSSYQNSDTAYTVKGENDFHDFFKGLYITTDFGSASMLNIRYMRIKYWFHYTYTNGLKASDGNDSIVKVNVSADFPYTNEVRMVNRFNRPDRQEVEAKLNADNTVNYIISPASMGTEIKIPFNDLRQRLGNVTNKRLLINRAALTVDINGNEEREYIPVASRLLLLKSSAYDRFFQNRELPSDSCAIMGELGYRTVNDSIVYCYKYDLSGLITDELKKADNMQQDTMRFRLVPVSIKQSGNKNVLEIKSLNTMTATKINSGSNPERPMKMEVVYSEF